MNKKVLLMAVVTFLLALILVSPVVAQITYYNHALAGGNTTIELPGQPQLRIRVLHYTWSSNHVIGAGDELIVYLKAVAGPPVNNWIPVACIVDNPSLEEWEKDLFSNMPLAGNTLLVKHSHLQIHKVGKNDIFAYWKESLTAEITGIWAIWLGVLSVTLPPGSLLIQGDGEELTGSLGPIPPIPPNPYTVGVDWKFYFAEATFECSTGVYYGLAGTSTMIKHATFYAMK